MSWADPPALVLVPRHSKAAGCLLGAGSAGEGSNSAQRGTTAGGCWRWATAAGMSSCHPGVSSPKHRSHLGEALMEKLFQKDSTGILEEPPDPPGRGMLQWGLQGAPTKAPRCCPCQSQQPCQGTARGKQAPIRAATPPACRLPSVLPVPARPGRAVCSSCQNPSGGTCRGMQATFSLLYSLFTF